MKNYRYVPCDLKDIPDGVTFSVPRANQGQFVEVAYGDFGRGANGPGDLYRRTTDHSTGRVTYEERKGAEIEPETVPPDSLYDSDTNDYVSADELGVSGDEYEAAIRESITSRQAEGHVLIAGRRVYAQ